VVLGPDGEPLADWEVDLLKCRRGAPPRRPPPAHDATAPTTVTTTTATAMTTAAPRGSVDGESRTAAVVAVAATRTAVPGRGGAWRTGSGHQPRPAARQDRGDRNDRG
jgi:hypothetical protein